MHLFKKISFYCGIGTDMETEMERGEEEFEVCKGPSMEIRETWMIPKKMGVLERPNSIAEEVGGGIATLGNYLSW